MPARQHYAEEIRDDLPPAAFQPTPSRLLWLAAHTALIAGCVTGILMSEAHWQVALPLSLLIGHSFACLAFLAHEILHGSVVRSRWMINLFGGFCFLPHCLPPHVWRTWHNRFHHGYTGVKGKDPDGFGSPVMYRRSRLLHLILTFLPGSGYVRSAFYFVFYFSFHVLYVLFLHSRKYSYWTDREWRKQVAIFTAEVLFWVGVAAMVGLRNFAFIYCIPLMIANAIQMTYVTTNHWLCDETHDENDPLRNSLSVKLPWIIDWLHLNTSYHVEHHVAPMVSPRYAREIHNAVRERHGERCRRLSLLKILQMTYGTPRVHLEEDELVDLRSGRVYSTLGPNGEPPQLVDEVPLPVTRRKPARTDDTPPVLLPFPAVDPVAAAALGDAITEPANPTPRRHAA